MTDDLSYLSSAARPTPSAPQRGHDRRYYQRHPEDPHVQALPVEDYNLSARESEILAWVALGKTNPEIGSILGISTFTVKNHVQRILKKLDVTNRTQAVGKTTARVNHG